jgi:acyl-CoA synthetase (AMP-forming)/AMP-acid ligase II
VSFVSVGTPLDGVSVEVRDDRGSALPEGHVGEVVVRSESVMTGYFRDAAATAEVLSEGWLKTGDLGYLKAGRLYITGRSKDIVIRAGRNYYPQDIEAAVTDVQGVRAGRVVAFSVPADDEEEVVVLAETEKIPEKRRLRSSWRTSRSRLRHGWDSGHIGLPCVSMGHCQSLRAASCGAETRVRDFSTAGFEA